MNRSSFKVACAVLSLCVGACASNVPPPATQPTSCDQVTCGANATCAVVAERATCSCDVGYGGDGQTCTDVDECTSPTAVCSTDATCTNRAGSYNCTCNAGFIGNGVSCTPSCGNGTCDAQAGESCESCPADCGVCDCAPCPTGSCASGTQCLVRACDGTPGCYASGANATCPTIGKVVCPKSAIYTKCSDSSDCCADYAAGVCPSGQVCLKQGQVTETGGPVMYAAEGVCIKLCQKCTGASCGTATGCPRAPTGTNGVTAACDYKIAGCPPNETCPDGTYCGLVCSSTSTCPSGQICNGHCQ